jgi:hypothetical protein
MIYSILDSSNVCINITKWDGQSEWQPPANCIAVPQALAVGKTYQYDNQLNKWIEVVIEHTPTEEELLAQCNYYAFWDALLISNVYQTIRAQAIQSLNVNTCCTEFIAAISDAKAGRANKNAIQACITLLMIALTLTTEETSELESVMAAGSLDKVYKLTVQ